ncbi:MAG: division/cell wall cluster transcriptional repressor MraZ [Gammaproteobacteria bacterium]|nr:division/cell wall cluster transcriptional repressor MraZ [Gammaproteobacteria bacterium]
MFLGANAVSLDSKGRIAMPSRYRDRLQESAAGQLVITLHWADPCLVLFPFNEFERVRVQLEALPSGNPVSRAIQRRVIGTANECELDSAGRVLLPALHRELAGLDSRVMLVGQSNKFELWNETRWKEQLAADQATIQGAGLTAGDFADCLKTLSF